MSDLTACPAIASPDQMDARLAHDAYRGTSHVPEDRAARAARDYADDVNGLYGELWALAGSEHQRELLAFKMEEYRLGYLRHMNAYHASLSRVVSSMIAGPSNFPAARMQQRGEQAHNRLTEFVEWRAKARAAIRKAILDARTEAEKEEAEWQALRRDLTGSLSTIIRIDRGLECYTRSAFTNSISGKLERLAKGGRVELVERALAWLREVNATGPKPVFTARHKVWTFGALARESAGHAAEPAARGRELIGSEGEIELWADREIDRVQLLFPDKPGDDVRARLKRSGWKWSPTNGAWQRQLTENGVRSGREFLSGHGLN